MANRSRRTILPQSTYRYAEALESRVCLAADAGLATISASVNLTAAPPAAAVIHDVRQMAPQDFDYTNDTHGSGVSRQAFDGYFPVPDGYALDHYDLVITNNQHTGIVWNGPYRLVNGHPTSVHIAVTVNSGPIYDRYEGHYAGTITLYYTSPFAELNSSTGELVITSSPGQHDDTTTIERVGNNVHVTVNGIESDFDIRAISKITVRSSNPGGGIDRVFVNYAGGDPLPASGLGLDNAAFQGSQTLYVQNGGRLTIRSDSFIRGVIPTRFQSDGNSTILYPSNLDFADVQFGGTGIHRLIGSHTLLSGSFQVNAGTAVQLDNASISSFSGNLTNYGTIAGNGGFSSTHVYNFGTIASAGTGGLEFYRSDVRNSAAAVLNASSSVMEYAYADVYGGTLSGAASHLIATTSGFHGVTVTASDLIVAADQFANLDGSNTLNGVNISGAGTVNNRSTLTGRGGFSNTHVNNYGTIRSDGAGGLEFYRTDVRNSNSAVLMALNSVMEYAYADVYGGILAGSASHLIATTSGLHGVTITASDLIVAADQFGTFDGSNWLSGVNISGAGTVNNYGTLTGRGGFSNTHVFNYATIASSGPGGLEFYRTDVRNAALASLYAAGSAMVYAYSDVYGGTLAGPASHQIQTTSNFYGVRISTSDFGVAADQFAGFYGTNWLEGVNISGIGTIKNYDTLAGRGGFSNTHVDNYGAIVSTGNGGLEFYRTDVNNSVDAVLYAATSLLEYAYSNVYGGTLLGAFPHLIATSSGFHGVTIVASDIVVPADQFASFYGSNVLLNTHFSGPGSVNNFDTLAGTADFSNTHVYNYGAIIANGPGGVAFNTTDVRNIGSAVLAAYTNAIAYSNADVYGGTLSGAASHDTLSSSNFHGVVISASNFSVSPNQIATFDGNDLLADVLVSGSGKIANNGSLTGVASVAHVSLDNTGWFDVAPSGGANSLHTFDTIQNSGWLLVGGPGIGGLIATSFTQTSTGVLSFDISGPLLLPTRQYDTMQVEQANLGGALQVTLTNDFVPAVGDVYHLLGILDRQGSFIGFGLPALQQNNFWVPMYTVEGFSLTVIDNNAFGSAARRGSTTGSLLKSPAVDQELTLEQAIGDFNRDTMIDGADYVSWADHFDSPEVAPSSGISAKLSNEAAPRNHHRTAKLLQAIDSAIGTLVAPTTKRRMSL